MEGLASIICSVILSEMILKINVRAKVFHSEILCFFLPKEQPCLLYKLSFSLLFLTEPIIRVAVLGEVES